MRVLALNWRDPGNPQAGGAEQHIWQVLSAGQRRGWDVRAITAGFKEGLSTEAIQGVPVTRVGSESTYSVHLPRHARSAEAEFEPDLVLECLNKLPLYASQYLRSPVACFVHHLFGDAAFHERGFAFGSALKAIEATLGLAYRQVPFLTGSHSSAYELQEYGIPSEHVTVVPYGAETDRFAPGCKATRPTLLYLGRIKRYKHVEDVLSAARALRVSIPELQVHVAGDGDGLEGLKCEAAHAGLGDWVRFHGRISEAEKLRLYQESWAFIFPSMKEGFGLTIPEAALCETPTVGYRVPGLTDAVADGETGLLVPYRDQERLAEAAQRLLTDSTLRTRMGQQARSRYGDFTWERSTEITLDSLERAAQTAQRPAAQLETKASPQTNAAPCEPAPAGRISAGLLSRSAGVLVSIGAAAWLVSAVDVGGLFEALARIPGWAAAASLGIILSTIPLRIVQWRLLLPARARHDHASTTDAVCLGYLADVLLPLRGGDLVRLLVVARRNALSLAEAAPSLLLARFQDLFPLLALSLGAVILVGLSGGQAGEALPFTGSVQAGIVTGAAAASAGFGILAFGILGRRGLRGLQRFVSRMPWPFAVRVRLDQTLARLETGLEGANDLRRLASAQGLSVACWALFVASALPLLFAFGFTPAQALAASVLQAGVATLAMMLPAAPAGIGSYHALCVLCLLAVRPEMAREAALAYALVAHALGAFGPALAGLVYLPANVIPVAAALRGRTASLQAREASE